jgi:dolichol kinase/phosphoserine phosphatase
MREENESSIVRSRLIVFDVEGVLIPKRRFLFFEISALLGFATFLKFFLFGVFYKMGLISLKLALKRIYWSLKGLPLNILLDEFRDLPILSGVSRIFKELKRLGYKTVLISSGIPRILVEDLANQLGADFASGLEIDLIENRLTGRIGGDVIMKDGKVTTLKKILVQSGFSSSDCIVIADDRNNLSLFRFCGFGIGLNPDFLLSLSSDFVIKGNLSSLLSIIENKTITLDHSLSLNHLFRELIHISGILIPLICKYFVDTYIVIVLVLIIILFYSLSEVLRLFGRKLFLITDLTLRSVSESELHEFALAPLLYAIGIIISLAMFPEPLNYASIAILTFGDGFASILGKRFGQTISPINKLKTIEGSIFGWFFAFLGSLIFIDTTRALIGATVGLVIESLPSPIDDNLAIPLASGFALSLWTLL